MDRRKQEQMRLSFFSLKNKFLIVTLGLITLLGITVLTFIKISLHKNLLNELQGKGIFMSHNLSDMSLQPLLTENIFSLQMMISDYKDADPDIEYIFISDRNENIIAHTFKNGFPTDLIHINPLAKGEDLSIQNIETEKGLIFDIATPVMKGEIGAVHIGLSQENIRKNLENIIGVVIKMIILVLLVGGAIAIAFSLKLSKPLSELVDVSLSIGKGDLDRRVKVKTRDEIGQLAETFNAMAENLLTSRNNLINSYKQLEHEIKERKLVEIDLDRSLTFLHSVFDSIRDPLIIFDNDYRIVKVNKAYADIKRKKVDDLMGKICYEALNGLKGVCKNCEVEATFKSKDSCDKEKHTTLPDGTEVWLEMHTYPILDEDRNVTHVIEYIRDISERKKAEAERKKLIYELEQLSKTDELTNLLNRRALIDILAYHFTYSKRYGSELSLMICDIDYLKTINDTYGHLAGDDAIKTVSEALKIMLRAPDIIGRYGGDEFLAILPETSLIGAKELAERIRQKIEKTDTMVSDDTRIRLTLSIGIADNSKAKNIDELISLADEALYTSKRMGRNRVYADKA